MPKPSVLNAPGRLAALPGHRKRALVEAFVTLWVVRIVLWLLPFRAVHRWWTRQQSAPAQHRDGHSRAAPPPGQLATPVTHAILDVVWAIRRAHRSVAVCTCLTQALTGLRMLQRRGLNGRLRIGVAAGQTGVDAHAWLEYRGAVLTGNPADTERFLTFDDLALTRPLNADSKPRA